MYSTHLRPAPSPLSRFAAWLASPALARALALSILVAATITMAFHVGHLPAQVVVVDTPRVVTQYVDVVPANAAGWAADESASGTQPDRAH